MALVNKVGRFFSAANNKADQLTAGIKGALCLPSIIAGLPDLGKGLIGSVVSNIGRTLENVAGTVSGIVTNTINGAVSQITGTIANAIGTGTDALRSARQTSEQIDDFGKGIKERVKDIGDFTSEKQNCDFAAATLLNCITAKAVGSVSTKGAVDLSKGIRPVADFANDVSEDIAKPGGTVERYVQKTGLEIDRATRVVDKSNIF